MIGLTTVAVDVLVGAGSLVWLGWTWWVPVHRRFATVAPRRVFKSGALSDRGLRRAVQRYKLRSIIDLRRPTPEVDHERELAHSLGLNWRNVPASQRPKPPVVDAFLQAVRDSEPPLLIHCMHGAGRARLFAAIYRIEFEGWSPERAARSLPWRMRRKRKWMRKYVPRRGEERVGEERAEIDRVREQQRA